MKIKKADEAISQIIGSAFLLIIGLVVLSTVYMNYLSYPLPNPAPNVDIVGDLEAGNVILLHNGGEALDLDTELRMNIGNTTNLVTVGPYLNDVNGDGKWSIGERVVYTPSEDITNLRVHASVIDKETDGIIMTGLFQEGAIPTVSDNLEFDPIRGNEPDIIHVSGNTYAIAYRGNNDDGFIDTVEIVNNGTITDIIIDTFEYDTDKGSDPDIIHVSGNTYAIAYGGGNDDGWLRTLQIAGNGDIE